MVVEIIGNIYHSLTHFTTVVGHADCSYDLLISLVVVNTHLDLCLIGGVLPYFEVTGHPVPFSSLGFKYPDCFIWYIVYTSKMKGSFRDNCPRYFYL